MTAFLQILRFYGIDFNDGRLRPASDSKQRRASFRLPSLLLSRLADFESIDDELSLSTCLLIYPTDSLQFSTSIAVHTTSSASRGS